MSKATRNNKGDGTPLDVDHELPPSEEQESGAAAQAPPSPTEPAAPEDELSRLKSESAAYLDRLARLQAEFDNYRKRNAREQQDFRDYALADAVKQLLPILDSLDRALKTPSASVEDFRSGIELIDRQFHDALARLGVEPIIAEGPFDPTLHQAVQMVPSDAVPENHVLDELQRGYRLKDRLLRPAMVRVAHKADK
jgi:molecular chaperone GrpE